MNEGMLLRITVGRVGRPHGVRGEVSVRPEPGREGLFHPGADFHTGQDDFPTLVVRAVRPAARGLLVEFAGITNRETAARLTGCDLLARPEESGGRGLVGLEVRREDSVVGVVAEVITGRQDRLVVSLRGGATAEVPLVDELVPEIRPEEGWLRVEPFEGLLD